MLTSTRREVEIRGEIYTGVLIPESNLVIWTSNPAKWQEDPFSFVIILTMPEHGGTKHESAIHGMQSPRRLNVTGRWATHGTAAAPLLVWSDMESAIESAQKASKVRARPVEWEPMSIRSIERLTAFSAANQPALLGFLPYAAAAARKLEAERLKVLRYAAAMVDVATATGEGAMRAATVKLRENYAGATFFNAAQHLSGNKALEIVTRIIDGELSCGTEITPFGLRFARVMATNVSDTESHTENGLVHRLSNEQIAILAANMPEFDKLLRPARSADEPE